MRCGPEISDRSEWDALPVLEREMKRVALENEQLLFSFSTPYRKGTY